MSTNGLRESIKPARECVAPTRQENLVKQIFSPLEPIPFGKVRRTLTVENLVKRNPFLA